MLYTFLIVVDTLLAISLIVLVLLNRGRGAEVGAAFGGSSSSASVFGSKGATPFITKIISVFAGLFLLNSLGLAYLVNSQYIRGSIVDKVDIEELQPDGFGDVPTVGGDEDSSIGESEDVGDDVPYAPSDVSD